MNTALLITGCCRLYCSTLDVSYVSSVSWYFLVSFGMRGFLSLILGEKSGTSGGCSRS
jgi:hypothetical protein